MNILDMGIRPSAEQAQQRAEQVRQLIQKMGAKYLCHPSRRVQRKAGK